MMALNSTSTSTVLVEHLPTATTEMESTDDFLLVAFSPDEKSTDEFLLIPFTPEEKSTDDFLITSSRGGESTEDFFPITSTRGGESTDEFFPITSTRGGESAEDFFPISSTTQSPLDNVTTNGTFDLSQRNVSFAKFYPYLVAEMALSILCLVLLVFVYYRIKEHKTIPGKIVLSLSICFILCYCLLILDFLLRTQISLVPCVLMALLIHSLFLAAFFWTNVMAYDIMRTLSSMKPNFTGPSARYWKYALYAWTMTMICSVPAFVIDNLHSIPEVYRPKFGRKRCWLSGTPAFLMYFNGPVGFILLANGIMFIVTAVTIIKVKNAAVAARVQPHKTRFRLYVKLVVIMGLIWITEFLPWWTGKYSLYAIAGILNCLHGVFIFVIFVCKARIWNKFKNTFECLKDDDKKKQPDANFHTSPSCSTFAITDSTSGSISDLPKLASFKSRSSPAV